MDIQNLVHMANRIGQFFAAMPDEAEAKAGIANHIQKFWEPRMRGQILALTPEQQNQEALLPLVAEALHQHRDSLMPKVA